MFPKRPNERITHQRGFQSSPSISSPMYNPTEEVRKRHAQSATAKEYPKVADEEELTNLRHRNKKQKSKKENEANLANALGSRVL